MTNEERLKAISQAHDTNYYSDIVPEQECDVEAEFFGCIFKALEPILGKEKANEWANTITADPSHENTKTDWGFIRPEIIIKEKND